MTPQDLRTLHDLYNKIARDIESGIAKDFWSIRRHERVTKSEAYQEAIEMMDKLKMEMER